MFDFVPGDTTPPPAPKHSTAASSRPKVQKMGAPGRRGGRASSSFVNPRTAAGAATTAATFSHSQDTHAQVAQSFNDAESIAQFSRESSSAFAEEDVTHLSQQQRPAPMPRKRKREGDVHALSEMEQQHIVYGDELLDYFMTVGDAPAGRRISPPVPPPNFQIDRPIDDQGNTALHWACAMGALEVVQDLLARGANIRGLTSHDETPLVRAVLFTNNYEKRTMPELAETLKDTISYRDWFGATVFNHIAVATKSRGKWRSSRYYCQVLIAQLRKIYSNQEVEILLASQDSNGDTAVLTAAKNGCFRVAEILLENCPDSGNLPNKHGETANEILVMIEQQRLRLGQPPDDPPSDASDIDGSEVEEAAQKGKKEKKTQSEYDAATSDLFQKIEGYIDKASERLSRAYDQIKSRPQNISDTGGHPKDIYEQLEAEREALQKESEDSLTRDADGEPYADLVNRHERAEQMYQTLLENAQNLTLKKRLDAMGWALHGDKRHLETTTAPANPATTTDSVADDTTNQKDDPLAKLALVEHLARAETTRHSNVSEMIAHRADAGPDARLNVHRRLVSLATGLPEKDLDPMARDLASNLEFSRANQTRAGKVGVNVNAMGQPS